MRTRAERRHHRNRIRNKVKDYQSIRWRKEDPANYEHNVNLLTETRALCSCHMCGNPRKHWNEKTMQEKRFEESTEDL